MFRTFAIAAVDLLDPEKRKAFDAQLGEFEKSLERASPDPGKDAFSLANATVSAVHDVLVVDFHVVKRTRQYTGNPQMPYAYEARRADQDEFEKALAAPAGDGKGRVLGGPGGASGPQ